MRKLTVILIILVYALSLIGVSVFAANARKIENSNIDPRDMITASQAKPEYTDIQLEQMPKTGKQVYYQGTGTSLGFRSSPFPQTQLGTSAYDIQHNSRMGRQIARGTDGRVHFVWTFTSIGSPNSPREVRYQSYKSPGGFSGSDPGGDAIDGNDDHMCNLDVNGVRGVPVFRYGAAFADYKSTSAIDFGSGTGSFTIGNLPSTATICDPGVPTTPTFHFIWPVVATDLDGVTPVFHVVAQEGDAAANFGVIAYYRGTGTTPTYGTCGKFVDSTLNISYDVAADPNSDKVIIAYTKGRQNANRENNDVAYRESTDRGVTWGPITNITNYATSAKERAFNEVSALYSSDGCAHILYSTITYDSGTVTSFSQQEAKLKHWTSCNPTCYSLILDANNRQANCNMKAFERNVCRFNISECNNTIAAQGPVGTRLFATYTRYTGDDASPNCSASSEGSYPNGDIYMSVSGDGGQTWAPPVNLTQTASNGCVTGTCDDDNFATCARYDVDSLHIEFMNDKAAGSAVGNEADNYTANPVIWMRVPCIGVATNNALTATPSKVEYPFHARPSQSTPFTLTLTNGGNVTANWTNTISYVSGAGWLSVPSAGNVTAGCVNSAVINCTAGPIAVQGLYQANINFTYNTSFTFTVPVDFYVFDPFALPQDVVIKTATGGKAGVGVALNVNQTSQTANQDPNNGFDFYTDPGKDFLYDGSLIMGNSRGNLSWEIFANGAGSPNTGNPFGALYAIDTLTSVDSTTSGSGPFRHASGKGVNRDSTIGFRCDYYTSMNTDSSDFVVASFKLYHGPKGSPATVTGLTIAYAGDWDVPDDSTVNASGVDASLNLIYQNSPYPAGNGRYGGFSAWMHDGSAIAGAYSWDNRRYVFPSQNFQVDSVWKYLQATSSFAPTDTVDDLSSVIIIKKGVSIGATDTLKFGVLLVGSHASGAKSLVGLKATVAKARQFLCNHAFSAPLPAYCSLCTCGDANGDHTINISDAVFLIQYIFGGGAAPNPLCNGDANGDHTVNISDAVFLIQYIFGGGPAPSGC